MIDIKPNIYNFYWKGEIMNIVDAYTIEVAEKNFFRLPENVAYDHITWYDGTFGTYHFVNLKKAKMRATSLLKNNAD